MIFGLANKNLSSFCAWSYQNPSVPLLDYNAIVIACGLVLYLLECALCFCKIKYYFLLNRVVIDFQLYVYTRYPSVLHPTHREI